MMAEYDNTNPGAIWKNEDKQTDSHPDFKGSLNVDGTEYWVSAWKRKPDAKPSAPALSFSIKLKTGNESKPAKAAAGVPDPYQDSDIPF